MGIPIEGITPPLQLRLELTDARQRMNVACEGSDPLHLDPRKLNTSCDVVSETRPRTHIGGVIRRDIGRPQDDRSRRAAPGTDEDIFCDTR